MSNAQDIIDNMDNYKYIDENHEHVKFRVLCNNCDEVIEVSEYPKSRINNLPEDPVHTNFVSCEIKKLRKKYFDGDLYY